MLIKDTYVWIQWIWAASLIRQKPVSIERRLKSWSNEYDFKWNQPYLSRGLNFSRYSNSLNSFSILLFLQPKVNSNCFQG